MKERYARNIGTITAEEQKTLMQKAVCVIGCGGLGGGIIENLTRMGVGKLTVVDKDVFDATNLNRQVLSNEGNLGISKAEEAAKQMKNINSEVVVTAVNADVTAENIGEIIEGHDVVVDAVDNVSVRLVMEDACSLKNIPIIHGAIGGWMGQVAVVRPGTGIMHMIYQDVDYDSGVQEGGNPSFTPALISAIQSAETIKVLHILVFPVPRVAIIARIHPIRLKLGSHKIETRFLIALEFKVYHLIGVFAVIGVHIKEFG